MAKTAIEKSHSKSSNAALTLVCLLTAIGFAGLFAFLGLKEQLTQTLFLIGLIGSGVILGLGVVLLFLFRR